MLTELEFHGCVATLDMLGFSSRASRRTPSQTVDEMVGPLLHTALLAQVVFESDLEHHVEYSRLDFLYFADTLVLYLPQDPDTIHSTPALVLESMVYTTMLVAATSMWLNIPVRGAIAYGDCVVCRDPLYFVGDAFLESHELEEQQDWAGIVLCDSARKYIADESPRLVEWNVPLKGGVVRSMLAVNWPGAAKRPESFWVGSDPPPQDTETEPDWDACFSSSSPDVAAKKQNTVEFFNASPNHVDVGVGPEQRESAKNWREFYASRRNPDRL